MKTIYLIWRNPSCAGVNPEWLEMSGQEFYSFINSTEAEGRHFIKLYSTEADGSDGVIVAEATEEQYCDWKKEKRHREYLRETNPGFTQISYHGMESEDGCYGEEMLVDTESNIDDAVIEMISLEQLSASLKTLTDEEYRIIHELYLQDEPKTIRQLASEMGIHFTSLNERKRRILKKLKI